MDMITPTIPLAGDDAAEKVRQLQRQRSGTDGLSEKQRQQAKKVSQDFEGLFIGMMMKSMRETVGKDPITAGGHGEDAYRSMLDQQYVEAAVKRGGFGLAKQIEKEIIRQESRKIGKTIDSHE
ncbi:rod-binding protein [Pelotalea chapellei]|uniref:Rod-binding protein n=1 Tax=Pelotalea chapellei TaxID=44671 RepID=A0ABS5U8C8_9BACT|nr:rod-binding protein [Pelotalea chapellei]MBT1071925.1 rod-binding protein [Pelotalea chapellei]